ncbi:MAG: elongation factor G, partial [Alphaproteobacteria bacterium]
CGAIPRMGSVREGNSVGDAAPEARAHHMSTEISAGRGAFLGEPWIFLDCPGFIEFAGETYDALMVADAAIVVCEPDPGRVLTVAPILKWIEDHKLPHLVFINKLDTAQTAVRDVLAALQDISSRPLVLRQIPIRDGETISGYVDLVSERAYDYKPGQPSELISIPDAAVEREREARTEMLETLADFDDALLEQLLEDAVPSPAAVYDQLKKDLQDDLVAPVFLGAAERDHGVRRLLKALRHEVPRVAATAARRKIPADGAPVAQVCKTYHAPHTGKLSLARVWHGSVSEGMTLGGERVGGVARVLGQQHVKIADAGPGEVVGLALMESVATGDLLTAAARKADPNWPAPAKPVYALAVEASVRADEVKMSGALAKIIEEDPALSLEQCQDTQELLLWGQGEIHLKIALERLARKYNLASRTARPQIPYKETIRRGTAQHARFKRQTGGHGQFADIHIEIKPLPRGGGFAFDNKITGGAIPKQYIPAVGEGVRDYLTRGPLGYPVVDLAVTLSDGSFHTVDSSDMAFKTAARVGMTEGMPKCDPVLLEPVLKIAISVPNAYTASAQRLISGHRGQILGYDSKPGSEGWEVVSGYLPRVEMADLIIELRSTTLGVGTFTWAFDHLQELIGREADNVVTARAEALAAS